METQDVYEDMAAHSRIYDTSDYPPDHPLYSTLNLKRIGCMKDEMAGELIFSFVRLRPKMYSILSEHGEKKTAKGVSRCVVKNKIRHDDYRSCLESLMPTRETLHRIQSKNHQLHTIRQRKIALCAFDDKRYMLDDGICTLAHGHYQMK